MIDLVSPNTLDNTQHEWITQIDEQDGVVAKIDKFVAHEHPAKLHRASSVWLSRINEKSEIEVLLQKRSKEKIVGAGWWANTCCGNVWWEESYEDCAKRRLFVELGVELSYQPPLKELYAFRYRAYCNEKYAEHEWVTVFGGRVDASTFQVAANPTQVEQTQWVLLSELLQKVENESNKLPSGMYTKPEETLKPSYSDEDLQSLTSPVAITVSGTEMLLAPWTVMMLFDERLKIA
jgi:isopentenyl-diphosphate Delta-isomerase